MLKRMTVERKKKRSHTGSELLTRAELKASNIWDYT